MDAIKKITSIFGPFVLNEDGAIDKKKLGDIVFSDKDKLKQLEKILHPKLTLKRKEFITQNKNAPLLLMDIPLLFEKNIDTECDDVLCVYCSISTQEKRVLERPHMSKQKWLRIKNTQMDIQQKIQQSRFSINTNQPVEVTKHEIHNICCQLCPDAIK